MWKSEENYGRVGKVMEEWGKFWKSGEDWVSGGWKSEENYGRVMKSGEKWRVCMEEWGRVDCREKLPAHISSL